MARDEELSKGDRDQMAYDSVPPEMFDDPERDAQDDQAEREDFAIDTAPAELLAELRRLRYERDDARNNERRANDRLVAFKEFMGEQGRYVELGDAFIDPTAIVAVRADNTHTGGGSTLVWTAGSGGPHRVNRPIAEVLDMLGGVKDG